MARFKADREQEYNEFLEQCKAFLSEIEKEGRHQKFTFAELEENEQNLQRLRKWIARIQRRDFFETKKTQEAVAAFQDCRQRLQDYTRQVYAQEGLDAPLDVDILSEGTGLAGQEERVNLE
jgi:vacuolar-type H+-ATPase subunit I/STV1